MTERETLLLREFKDKLEQMIGLHQKMKAESQLLKEEKKRLNEQLNLLTISNRDLAKKVEDLRFAKTLVGANEDSHEAKIKINRLVREIDKCISLLNK
jgi:cell shape-determining protein MreC